MTHVRQETRVPKSYEKAITAKAVDRLIKSGLANSLLNDIKKRG